MNGAHGIQRHSAYLFVVLQQRGVANQVQQRLAIARQPARRTVKLGSLQAELEQEFGVRALVLGNVDAYFFQLSHPGRPADPIFVVAQVDQGGQTRFECEQFGHPLGVQQAEVHGDVGAETMAHQDGPLDPHFIQEAAQILGHIGRSVACGGYVAVAVAAQVVGSDPVLAAQNRRHVEVPDGQISEEAVQHDDIGAHAYRNVVQIDAVRLNLWHSEAFPPFERHRPGSPYLAGTCQTPRRLRRHRDQAPRIDLTETWTPTAIAKLNRPKLLTDNVNVPRPE